MLDNRSPFSLSLADLRSRALYYRQMANTAPVSIRARDELLRLAEEYGRQANKAVNEGARLVGSTEDRG
jgi:hypothetical protein